MKKRYQIDQQRAVQQFRRLATEQNPNIQMILPMADIVGLLQEGVGNLLRHAGLELMHLVMDEEVKSLAGERHQQHERRRAHRWGTEDGYCVVDGQKVPIKRTRLRSGDNREQRLGSYELFQRDGPLQQGVWDKMMRGLSTRNYGAVVKDFQSAYGIEKSAVSENFIEASREKVKQLMERPLGELRLCAVLIDGTPFKDRQMIAALGIGCDGRKTVLGIREGATENTAVVSSLLSELVERGLDFSTPRLYILDGGKALHAAVRRHAGETALIQRCQVHKKRNVVDHDGKADLALAESSRMSVLLGNGNGTFQAAVNDGTGYNLRSIAVGDFNGDGKADLAVANASNDDVSVLLGNGDGTFQAAVNYFVQDQPQSIAVGDFNGDGRTDLAVASNNTIVSLFFGNGNGTFQAAATYLVGGAPSSTALGDFNGDGRADLAVACLTSANVAVLVGLAPSIIPSKVGLFRLGFDWLEDVDGDQQFNSPPDKEFVLGLPGGIFGVPGDIPISGDWNGSGTTKVGVYRSANGIFFLDYDGDGRFTAADKAYDLGVFPDASDQPVVGDWNGDGKTKVGLFRQGFLWILDANGDGMFQQGVDQAFAFGGIAGDVPVVGDWNGSGTSKIGLFRQGFFWILDADGNGVLDNVNGTGGDLAFAYGGLPGDVPVVGDWNGDGKSKVGIFRSGFFWVLDADGDHRFGGTEMGQDLAFPFGGITGDIPVVGKW